MSDRMDWRMEDPVGALLEMTGSHRLGDLWRAGRVSGIVATGVDRAEDGAAQYWLAVRTDLDESDRNELLREGFIRREEFRSPRGHEQGNDWLSASLDPFTTSALEVITLSRELRDRAEMLENIIGAKRTASHLESILGGRLPRAVLPTWDEVKTMYEAPDDSWLATDQGSLTDASWEGLTRRIRSGSPDGIRVRRDGDTVAVAGAFGSVSFVLDEETPTEAAALVDLLASVYWFSVNPLADKRLGESGDGSGPPRLFHVEHTPVAGPTVSTFDPWVGQMVVHPGMTVLWEDAISKRGEDAESRLKHAAWMFNARLGNVGLESQPG